MDRLSKYSPPPEFRNKLTPENFLTWAKTKPADEVYNYSDVHGSCPVDQFLKSVGLDRCAIKDNRELRRKFKYSVCIGTYENFIFEGLDLSSTQILVGDYDPETKGYFNNTFGDIVRRLEIALKGKEEA